MEITEKTEEAVKKPRGRPRGKPFPKGVSGNPGGRPKGLAALIKEFTKDGEELVSFWYRVFKGEELIKIGDKEFSPTFKERLEAAAQLANRGFGLPAQPIEASGPNGEAISIEINRTVKK